MTARRRDTTPAALAAELVRHPLGYGVARYECEIPQPVWLYKNHRWGLAADKAMSTTEDDATTIARLKNHLSRWPVVALKIPVSTVKASPAKLLDVRHNPPPAPTSFPKKPQLHSDNAVRKAAGDVN